MKEFCLNNEVWNETEMKNLVEHCNKLYLAWEKEFKKVSISDVADSNYVYWRKFWGYAVSRISDVKQIFKFILKHKKMNKTQLVMHLTILFILVVMTLLRFFTSWDINYFTYVMCIVPIVLFFSSESSAYLLGKEMEESNKNLAIINKQQNDKINGLSSELREPLSNIIYSNTLLQSNQLSEEEFKNEKTKVYNETYKLYNIIYQSSQNTSEVNKQ